MGASDKKVVREKGQGQLRVCYNPYGELIAGRAVSKVLSGCRKEDTAPSP